METVTCQSPLSRDDRVIIHVKYDLEPDIYLDNLDVIVTMFTRNIIRVCTDKMSNTQLNRMKISVI